MDDIRIGSRVIGESHPAFIIAELSANHVGDFEVAKKTVYAMKEAGADCLKLQTAKPDSITIDSRKSDFVVSGGTQWDGKTLFELYQEVYTPWEWHAPLRDLAHELGMEFFSSPFDFRAVDFLEELNVPAYKIASFEITDIPLIKRVAETKKPIIISTGIAEWPDVELAVNTCREVGNDKVILLKCTSAYPTPLEEVNLRAISTLREGFNCHIGLSDHTLGLTVPNGAVALGAKVIEKHFILDRSLGGPDASFSLEPSQFKQMVESVRQMELALGRPSLSLSEKIRKSKRFARSLYVVQDLKKGEAFSDENVRSIRPGFGMAPKYLPEIIGKKANRDIERGTAMSDELIEES